MAHRKICERCDTSASASASAHAPKNFIYLYSYIQCGSIYWFVIFKLHSWIFVVVLAFVSIEFNYFEVLCCCFVWFRFIWQLFYLNSFNKLLVCGADDVVFISMSICFLFLGAVFCFGGVIWFIWLTGLLLDWVIDLLLWLSYFLEFFVVYVVRFYYFFFGCSL
jgi:hypothetical protein